jgi:hypothetical protein
MGKALAALNSLPPVPLCPTQVDHYDKDERYMCLSGESDGRGRGRDAGPVRTRTLEASSHAREFSTSDPVRPNARGGGRAGASGAPLRGDVRVAVAHTRVARPDRGPARANARDYTRRSDPL